MYLVVGLGNPGSAYDGTRHNIGFMVLDKIAAELSIHFSGSKWNGETVKTVYKGQQVVFVKPMTFMNLSGQCVAAAAHYYKITHDHIIVIHDDLDLDIGRVKICQNRGHGGHNGLKSIMSHLGSREFLRIKLGIGRNPLKIPVEKYVLSKFSQGEERDLESELDLAVEGLVLILEKGMSEAMQVIHSRK